MKFSALSLCSLMSLGLATTAAAQDAPTFYQDALPFFMNNCAACHQDNPPDVGGISAPMSLMDYEQAKIWAPLIENAVATGYAALGAMSAIAESSKANAIWTKRTEIC